MRKVEETKTKLLKEVERNSERLTGESTGHEEEHLIDTEIEEAKARLEEAQAKSDKIEGKIAKLHDQIHQFTSEYHKMEEEGKRELDYHLKEISDLREHVGNQDRKLNMLKQKLEQTAHDSVCKHQNSCGLHQS
ncbi:protein BCAP-like [Halyomorpha halys]|uniref:protein BCAP-like n=1 Tax=Halyomorpha halys TaxID=286706 RepID=UPI0034D22B1F